MRDFVLDKKSLLNCFWEAYYNVINERRLNLVIYILNNVLDDHSCYCRMKRMSKVIKIYKKYVSLFNILILFNSNVSIIHFQANYTFMSSKKCQ